MAHTDIQTDKHTHGHGDSMTDPAAGLWIVEQILGSLHKLVSLWGCFISCSGYGEIS